MLALDRARLGAKRRPDARKGLVRTVGALPPPLPSASLATVRRGAAAKPLAELDFGMAADVEAATFTPIWLPRTSRTRISPTILRNASFARAAYAPARKPKKPLLSPLRAAASAAAFRQGWKSLS
jgi:hypothetical protein